MSERRATSSTTQLLRASSDDEVMLSYPVPHSGFGFHAQQAVEKLYKALLADRLGAFPFSHDLKSLRKRVEAAGFTLPICDYPLERLSEYAGNSRYDEPIPIDAEQRAVLRRCIRDLRVFVEDQTVSDREKAE